MAEFCFDCFKNYFDPKAKVEDLIFEKGLGLCEGCASYKSLVVRRKTRVALIKRLKKEKFEHRMVRETWHSLKTIKSFIQVEEDSFDWMWV